MFLRLHEKPIDFNEKPFLYFKICIICFLIPCPQIRMPMFSKFTKFATHCITVFMFPSGCFITLNPHHISLLNMSPICYIVILVIEFPRYVFSYAIFRIRHPLKFIRDSYISRFVHYLYNV